MGAIHAPKTTMNINLDNDPSPLTQCCIILLMALAFAAVVVGYASDLP